MCIQVVERYTICRCLYYKHPVDGCLIYRRKVHEVETREVLVGYTCPEHSSSSVYRPSGELRARRQAPENYQSAERESRPRSPVSVQSEGSHQRFTESSDNGPAVGSDESGVQALYFASDLEDADTDAPHGDLLWRSLPFDCVDSDAPNQDPLWHSPRTDVVDQEGGAIAEPGDLHLSQSEVQITSTSRASPEHIDTRHAPFPVENMCPHYLMQSAGAWPRECCWVVEQSIESGNATTDISRRQLYHLLRDSLTIAFANLSRGNRPAAVIQSSNSCQGTNNHPITDPIVYEILQSDRNTDASTTHALQPPTAILDNLQEREPPSTATSHTSKTEKRTCIPPCYLLIFLGLLTVIGSLIPGLWRASSRNDLSGGFSLAQYILGVGIFIVGSMVAIHSKSCECWKTDSGVHVVVGGGH